MRFLSSLLAAAALAAACAAPDATTAPRADGVDDDGDVRDDDDDAAGHDDDDERPATAAPSACTTAADGTTCPYETLWLSPSLSLPREVHFATPRGDAPTAGWPVVVFFQGSLVSGERAFSSTVDETFGQHELVRTVQALLDAGFVVVAPEAHGDGRTAWETNIPPCSVAWEGCPDDRLVDELLAALDASTFGSVDPQRRYAMGISSGGYMTSRMALSYAGRFRALVVHSASYATCGGEHCEIPAPLPAGHPPTLVLHGALDDIAPLHAATAYHDALVAEGFDARLVVGAGRGHAWIVEGVDEVPAWFTAHP